MSAPPFLENIEDRDPLGIAGLSCREALDRIRTAEREQRIAHRMRPLLIGAERLAALQAIRILQSPADDCQFMLQQFDPTCSNVSEKSIREYALLGIFLLRIELDRDRTPDQIAADVESAASHA